MAEDIDIEEHDLLQNPKIKRLFPDLSVLKQEFMDIDEADQPEEKFIVNLAKGDALDVNVQPACSAGEVEEVSPLTEETAAQIHSTEEGTDAFINKSRTVPVIPSMRRGNNKVNTDLANRADNSKKTDIANELKLTTNKTNTNVLDTPKTHQHSFQSKIILGSKPNKDIRNLKSDLEKIVKVTLQNIKPYLTRTKRFCDMCLILFPNKETLKNHKLSTHTTLHYRSNMLRSGFRHEELYNHSITRPECKINDINQRNIEKNINKNQIKDNMVNINELQTNLVIDATRRACFHCDKVFTSQQDLIDHLYNILYIEKAQVTPENIKNKKVTQIERKTNTSNIIIQKTQYLSSDIEKKKEISKSESFNSTIYSCPICSYYFNYKISCTSHVVVKHRTKKHVQIEKTMFNPTCIFCNMKHYDILSYNTHLRKSHKIEMHKPGNAALPSNNIESNLYFNNNLTLPESTVDNHVFNRKQGQLSTIVHHSKRRGYGKPAYDNKNIQVMAAKIILFKCSECNIHFLTSDAAFNHSEHLKNENIWECNICYRLLKHKDANIHRAQHKYSKYFKNIEIVADVSSRTLYKCPSCAVHFSKENFYKHISEREHKSPDSTYCRICDICVDSNNKEIHEYHHNFRNLTPLDFKIINSKLQAVNCESISRSNNNNCLDNLQKQEKPYLVDCMLTNLENPVSTTVNSKRNNVTNVSKSLFGNFAKKHLIFNYCIVCKCNISIDSKPDIHLKTLCVNNIKYICKYCGLMFSNKSITTHRKLHHTYNNLKLQDFTFYNLQTNKEMKPVIPEFPKCDLCEKHFISKVEVKEHPCSKSDSFICSICKTKFSETAYKLHLPFHRYSFKNRCKKSIELINNIKSKDGLNDINGRARKKTITSTIYTCKNCNLSISMYDEVIEHCHLHTNLNKVEVNAVECTICQLKFVNSSYDKHSELHTDFDVVKFARFSFDLMFFGSDNNKWLKHIFKSLSNYKVNNLIGNSIYKYETRIKMEVLQEGSSNFTIYKCENCQCIVDFNSTYSHIATCCPNSEISECTFCDLAFACSVTKNNHEKIHGKTDINVKSYKIVIFNRKQDRNINYNISNLKKYYVVYECRSCHVVVDNYNYIYHKCSYTDLKKCNDCGLLIYKENFDDHIKKHKLLPTFNENNIKVVLLGNRSIDNNIVQNNDHIVPTFKGIVCDYTFYKCINCEVCVRDFRNTVQHSCLIGAAKSQCIKCDLIFDEGKLKGHLKLHDTDPDFTTETILVNPFTNRKASTNVDERKLLLASKIEKHDKEITSKSVKNVINSKTTQLYKCVCGLHYLQQSSLEEHTKKCSGKNKTKVSTHECSKCGLKFTSRDLFKHLLEHHGDKNVVYKYEIVMTENSL